MHYKYSLHGDSFCFSVFHNREIAQKDRWTVQDIMARTEELAAELLKIYSLS